MGLKIHPVGQQAHGQSRGCNDPNSLLLQVWNDFVDRVVLKRSMAV